MADDPYRRIVGLGMSLEALNVAVPIAAAERKAIPLAEGCLDYFPAALIEVAKLSKVGNYQHNSGQALHWDRSKSVDHADCILRHLVDRGLRDTDGVRHSTKVAWRALALLQMELEADGAAIARGATRDAYEPTPNNK